MSGGYSQLRLPCLGCGPKMRGLLGGVVEILLYPKAGHLLVEALYGAADLSSMRWTRLFSVPAGGSITLCGS